MNDVQRKKSVIDICAFGGGPGTEMLGLAKRIEKIWRDGSLENQLVLDFLLLDQVTEWLDSWRAIRRQIEERFSKNLGKDPRTWPLSIRGDHSGINILDTTNFGNLVTIFEQDIYMLSYIISEIFLDLDILKCFTTKIATNAPIGSKFLFIDRKEEQWKNAIRDIAGQADIILSDFHDVDSSLSLDEQKTDLGEIYSCVSRNPRTTCRAFWVVGTKN